MSKQIGIVRASVTVAAATAFVVTWSSGFLIPAIATVDDSPLTLLVWRFAPLAVVLIGLVWVSGSARGATPKDIGTQALIGLFAQFGYCVAVYAAIAAGIATGTVALIDAVQPLVVAVLVGPLLGLRVRGMQWAGLALGAVGVLLVVRSQFGSSAASPIAYLLPALAMVCLIIGTFIQRRSPAQTGVLLTLTIHVVVTSVLLVIVAAVTGSLAPPASPSFWLAVVLTALFPTLAAYGLYWWLLRRVGITVLNALLFLIAPTTALGGGILLGETLTAVTIAGFVLCGVGVAAVLVGETKNGEMKNGETTNGRSEASGPATKDGPDAAERSGVEV
ncbi:DMT family transporter [Microbacterium sp. 3J1]|uniref:DMT family transporter n=1 Tax=Microbacterium sp. 3J1 TaxID=861269 RepID=UPI000B0016C4|nr:DMT family transporter [Microbacterium sp. 3J1]